MDELEKLLAFVETEIVLINGLEQTSRIEAQCVEDLRGLAESVLDCQKLVPTREESNCLF
jgi:hypothetical protein